MQGRFDKSPMLVEATSMGWAARPPAVSGRSHLFGQVRGWKARPRVARLGQGVHAAPRREGCDSMPESVCPRSQVISLGYPSFGGQRTSALARTRPVLLRSAMSSTPARQGLLFAGAVQYRAQPNLPVKATATGGLRPPASAPYV